MGNLITELKRIPSSSLIYKLSEISITMFKQQKVLLPIKGQQFHRGMLKDFEAYLSPWDIPYIDYLSICNSNDHRNPLKSRKLSELIALYRNYENKHSVADMIRESEINGIMRILTGMTAEQFLYENMRWVFQSFNRNYFILIVLQEKMERPLINVEEIVRETLGIGADEYNVILTIIMWLCWQHPDPLTAPEQLYTNKGYPFLTKEIIRKVIHYYSCSYKEIRSSKLQKQIMYSKPFIHTDDPETYLACTTHLVTMTLGTGLYWLIRDHYSCQSQLFVNFFGALFEEYIKNISFETCLNGEFNVLKTEQDEKSADFLYEFDGFRMIVEAKSTLLGLNAKQQVPEVNTIDSFIDRTINKAYKQLLSSCSKIQANAKKNKPAIKIVLLFDVFSNTALLEHSVSNIFENDTSCYIMTIREFETFLLIYRDHRPLFEQVTESILQNAKKDKQQKCSFTAIFDAFKLWDYDFFEADRDYFHKMINQMESKPTQTYNSTQKTEEV